MIQRARRGMRAFPLTDEESCEMSDALPKGAARFLGGAALDQTGAGDAATLWAVRSASRNAFRKLTMTSAGLGLALGETVGWA